MWTFCFSGDVKSRPTAAELCIHAIGETHSAGHNGEKSINTERVEL